MEQINSLDLSKPGPMVVDVVLHPSTLIEPKVEMGHSIEDQFPYISDQEYAAGTRFAKIARKSKR